MTKKIELEGNELNKLIKIISQAIKEAEDVINFINSKLEKEPAAQKSIFNEPIIKGLSYREAKKEYDAMLPDLSSAKIKLGGKIASLRIDSDDQYLHGIKEQNKSLIHADELIKEFNRVLKNPGYTSGYNKGFNAAMGYAITFINSRLPAKEEELKLCAGHEGESMRKVVEYKTLYYIHAHELDAAIKLWLDKGWELYMSPYSCNNDYDGQYMCQAMVKYEEEK